MAYAVEDKSETLNLAQVLRGWSCKEGELGTKGIKAVGPSPRHEEYR